MKSVTESPNSVSPAYSGSVLLMASTPNIEISLGTAALELRMANKTFALRDINVLRNDQDNHCIEYQCRIGESIHEINVIVNCGATPPRLELQFSHEPTNPIAISITHGEQDRINQLFSTAGANTL